MAGSMPDSPGAGPAGAGGFVPLSGGLSGPMPGAAGGPAGTAPPGAGAPGSGAVAGGGSGGFGGTGSPAYAAS